MIRAGEPDREEESNEKMNTIYSILNALHSIYLDGPAFGICGEWSSLFDYLDRKGKCHRRESSPDTQRRLHYQ
jgi:hypothetical protein